MKDVILIYPASPLKQTGLYPPLGLGYISSFLKKNNVNVKVIDLTFDPNFIKINKLCPTNAIYGISCTTPLYSETKIISKLIKEKDPNGIIVVGGAHATILPEFILNDCPNIDIIVIGEGEYTMLDIAKGIQCQDIPGIYYRKDNSIVKTSDSKPIQDLNTLSFPDQHAFPVEEYFKAKGFRELSISTTRGCPSDCIFCQPVLRNIFGNKVRYRDAKNIVDEIEWLIKEFKLDILLFSDDTFGFNEKRTKEICQEIINRKIYILWRVQTRVGLSKETLSLMKRAGCFLIAYGVESGSQIIIDSLNKHITIEEIKISFQLTKEIGILSYAYLMVGSPGETIETVQETVKLIKEIKPFSSSVAITTPYPGTHLSKSINMNIKDYNYSNHAITIYQDMVHSSLCDMTKDDIKKAQDEIYQTVKSESTKIKDIIRLIDISFIRIIINTIRRDPKFIKRGILLMIRGMTSKQGIQAINPLIKIQSNIK